MSPHRIAIVEDDKNIRNLVESYMLKEGYEPIGLETAEKAEELWRSNPPDLWILDIMLPGMDGYELCRRIRKKSENPIIMISAQDEDMKRIMGIRLGSDDYLTKPFNPQELVARVNRLLYRWGMISKYEPSITETKEIKGQTSIPGLQIFAQEHRVIWNEVEVVVSTKEFSFLQYLVQHINRPCSREVLLDEVWGYDFVGSDRNVDHFVKRLRKKMDGLMLETLYGYGYRLSDHS